jgi:hypothetical protein
VEAFESFGDESGPVQAPMHPAWIRLLPCSIELFRVVPSLGPFPASWWDDAMEGEDLWSEPVWCDPGDVDEWIAEAREHLHDTSAEVIEKEVREEYDRATRERSERIDRFTRACARAGLPVPHTVRELFEFLLAIGLYRGDRDNRGRLWVVPQLYTNPLDVLAFDKVEAAEESADQRNDYEELTAIAIRRVGGIDYDLDEEGRPSLPGGWARADVSLSALSEEVDVPAQVLRGMLLELKIDGDVRCGVDLETIGLADLFELEASEDLLGAYPNDELLPPEHA